MKWWIVTDEGERVTMIKYVNLKEVVWLCPPYNLA